MINYDPKRHKYEFKGKEIESVTSYIKRFKNIDTYHLLMSKYKMSREDVIKAICKDDNEISQEKAKWQKKSEEAMTKGSHIHDLIAKELKGEHQNDPMCDMVMNWIKDEELEVVKVEEIIFSEKVYLAGTIDALFKTKNGKYLLVDWKTGGPIRTQSEVKMKPPYDKYDDCPMSHYYLQLNLYSQILQHLGYPIHRKLIVHVRESELSIYEE